MYLLDKQTKSQILSFLSNQVQQIFALEAPLCENVPGTSSSFISETCRFYIKLDSLRWKDVFSCDILSFTFYSYIL